MIFSINTPGIRKVRNAPAPEIKIVPPDNTQQSRMFLQMGMVDRIKGATHCDSCKGTKYFIILIYSINDVDECVI